MFQYKEEAEWSYKLLKERLRKFKLELSEEKTRIIEFGRFATKNESFDFLGFTHYNNKTSKGKYVVKHKISKKKKRAKKQAIKIWLKENIHRNIVDLIEKLNKKLIGTYAYYGTNGMYKDLLELYKYTKYQLYRVMCKRSQRKMKVRKYIQIMQRIPIVMPKIYVQIW